MSVTSLVMLLNIAARRRSWFIAYARVSHNSQASSV